MRTLFDLPPKLPELALSYGLEALIAEAVQGQEGQLSAQLVATTALRLYPEKMVKNGIENLTHRFVKRVERLASAAPATPSEAVVGITPASAKPRTLGANLEAWTQKLDPSGICLFLANFDPERALHLYWWSEADLLEIALREKLQFASVAHINQFEATMYGFGGKYSDEGGNDGNAVVKDAFSDQGMEALKGFGIGIGA